MSEAKKTRAKSKPDRESFELAILAPPIGSSFWRLGYTLDTVPSSLNPTALRIFASKTLCFTFSSQRGRITNPAKGSSYAYPNPNPNPNPNPRGR